MTGPDSEVPEGVQRQPDTDTTGEKTGKKDVHEEKGRKGAMGKPSQHAKRGQTGGAGQNPEADQGTGARQLSYEDLPDEQRQLIESQPEDIREAIKRKIALGQKEMRGEEQTPEELAQDTEDSLLLAAHPEVVEAFEKLRYTEAPKPDIPDTLEELQESDDPKEQQIRDETLVSQAKILNAQEAVEASLKNPTDRELMERAQEALHDAQVENEKHDADHYLQGNPKWGKMLITLAVLFYVYVHMQYWFAAGTEAVAGGAPKGGGGH